MLKNAGHRASKGVEVSLRTLTAQGFEVCLVTGIHMQHLSPTQWIH